MCSFVLFAESSSDCPGPQSESAGKSDACEGCPNQEVCATAPKGPDPGILSLTSTTEILLCFSCKLKLDLVTYLISSNF